MTAPEPRAKPVVLASYENDSADRCVDLFQRPDGSFGFEEYRRDPEDAGRWSRIGWFGERRHATRDDALAAAKTAVAWFGSAAPKS